MLIIGLLVLFALLQWALVILLVGIYEGDRPWRRSYWKE